MDLAVKVTTLILATTLSKLKTHVVRKREIYNKYKFRRRKPLNSLQGDLKYMLSLERNVKGQSPLKNKERK